MPDWPIEPSEAVILCTRNRPDDLAVTLRSVAEQSGADDRLVLVVDGSDEADAKRTGEVVKTTSDTLPFHYHRYEGSPAQTRQRNEGIDLLPSSVNIVHFIDDDVTLGDKYFETLSSALQRHPSLLGIGGVITHPGKTLSSPRVSSIFRLFLLHSSTPSRVLPSGQTTPPGPKSKFELQPAEWLSTCSSSYRRQVFSNHIFDPEVEGPSPTLHDLDFSFRVSREGSLAIHPQARCLHHRSSVNRRDVFDTARERTIRRYWFVQKNMGTSVNRLAFWWSILGRLLICALSTTPNSDEARRGVWAGIRTIWKRDHPLLRRSEGSSSSL